jgi:predicted kinase
MGDRARALLIIFGGLSGTGKTTIAKMLALRCGAVYLRIDSFEQKIREANVLQADVGPAGYMAAHAIAEDNLRLGHVVIADSVNPLEITRAAWRSVARVCSADLFEVEVVCSDEAEHRRRVETRSSNVPGLTLPDWDAVEQRDYEPWPEPHLTIDTAILSAEEASARILAEIGGGSATDQSFG